nr:MAG TPA: hypothetical protein [Caudoviricetes sp.]
MLSSVHNGRSAADPLPYYNVGEWKVHRLKRVSEQPLER